jgi:hypothetical protein
MASSDAVDVLIVAHAEDDHARVVLQSLSALGAHVCRYNLDDLRVVSQLAEPGSLNLLSDNKWNQVDTRTTVWWHRAGIVAVEDLDALEGRLAQEEALQLLRGGLLATGARFVDDPFAIDRAETKELQLRVASELGIRIPATLVTNHLDRAKEFASGRRIIAKAVSSGEGIAPFVAECRSEDLAPVETMPVMLQERVDARADVRIVVVGAEGWVWRRPREATTTDWRAVDPSGSGFVPIEQQELVRTARLLTSALGLTMSVQDWLETKDGPVFLEGNPQGQWIFLAGSRELVPSAVAEHLLGMRTSLGQWPDAAKRLRYDFQTKKSAPANDGIEAPVFARPVWIDEVARFKGALALARDARIGAEAGAAAAEGKAGRLVQVGLALLTITLALGAYQASFAFSRSWMWDFSLIPVIAALSMIALATFEAQQVDRVGMYRNPNPEDLAARANGDDDAAVLASEYQGLQLARWTSNHKHTDLMTARAWFSRGLAALLVAAVLASGARALTTTAHSPPATGSGYTQVHR